MPTNPMTRAMCEDAVTALNDAMEKGERFPLKVASVAIGKSPRATTHRLVRAVEAYGMEVPESFTGKSKKPATSAPELELPEQEQDYEKVVKRKAEKYEKRDRYERVRKLIPVKIPYKGSVIGIWHGGDLHLDDDDCDILQARRHAHLVRDYGGVEGESCGAKNGCYGLLVGDVLNNWIGGLARKYSEQSTTLAEAHILANGYITQDLYGCLLALIGGNHDEWGTLRYFLDKIAREAKTRYIDSGAGLGIKFSNGAVTRIRVAHQLPGNSIYHCSQGQLRDMWFRYRWELNVSGHIHKSGYITIKQEDTEVISHGIQVASYQVHNHYARQKSMKDAHISPCALTTINSNLPNTHADHIKLFWDPEEGVDYLAWMQKRHDG